MQQCFTHGQWARVINSCIIFSAFLCCVGLDDNKASATMIILLLFNKLWEKKPVF